LHALFSFTTKQNINMHKIKYEFIFFHILSGGMFQYWPTFHIICLIFTNTTTLCAKYQSISLSSKPDQRYRFQFGLILHHLNPIKFLYILRKISSNSWTIEIFLFSHTFTLILISESANKRQEKHDNQGHGLEQYQAKVEELTSSVMSSSNVWCEHRFFLGSSCRLSCCWLKGSTTTCSVPLISHRQNGHPCPSESCKF
jgi:hypothetical protein